VAALVRWLSGAQHLTFLHTPDSEFYFSLGSFGSAVTDRAPDDYYYWTKLGVVLPLRALASFLPPLVALDVLHTILTVIVAGSAYAVARTGWSRPGASLAAAFATLNTVVVGFIGDPYAAGTAIAGLSALLATAVWWLRGDRPCRWPLAALMGLLGAWLVMVNPYSLVVGAAGFAGVLVAGAGTARRSGVRVVGGSLVALVGAFTGAFLAFLALGRWAFPGLSWFSSLGQFLFNADLSSWAEPDWRWAATEISLLVPISAGVVSLIALRMGPAGRSARTAAGLATVTPVAALMYKLVSDSNILEVSVYNSMLWPAALLAVVLVASTTAEPRLGRVAGILLAAAPLAWILAGHWSREVSTPTALAAATCVTLAAGALLAWARTGRVLITTWPVLSAGVAVLVVLGSLFQVLQNGLPQHPTGTLSRVSYSWAFRPGAAGAYLDQDARVQAWLIDQTDPHAQLLVWNEPETRSAASMQLWGSNSAGPGFGEPLGTEGIGRVRDLGADAVVTYATRPTSVDRVRSELDRHWQVADPVCRTFTSGAAVRSLTVCILRLGDARM
jgi:hypothetical protein